jgi:drug/metabolite transporter (DMT)-like permease
MVQARTPHSASRPQSPLMPEPNSIAPPERPLTGIAFKVASTIVFTGMLACIKTLADRVPTGEIVFFRSFLALVPIFLMLIWRRETHLALRTRNLAGHAWRGAFGVTSMVLWFLAVAMLPLPEALAIGYASPLITVALSALMLGEVVRAYRWGAVVAGFLGILLILSPRIGAAGAQGADAREIAGAAAALGSAFFVSLAMIYLRRLTSTETTPAIVVYFAILATLISLVTVPFGWVWPDPSDLALLVATGLLGGVGQILLTESYRHAEASTIASFDYTGMVWGFLIAFLIFGEVPGWAVAAGTLIVIASGLLIIWRERAIRRRGGR